MDKTREVALSHNYKNSEKTLEINLYDEIGIWGILAKDVSNILTNNKSAKTINVHINSPGGDVFEGFAIYSLLKNSNAEVIVDIDSMALSIATIIACAADKVRMAGNAIYMIHNPWVSTIGNINELNVAIQRLQKLQDIMIATYKKKSSQEKSQIALWMDEETWFDSEEALASGFVDEITNPLEIAARARPRENLCKNIPQKYEKYFIDYKDFSNIKKRISKMSEIIENNKRLQAEISLKAN